MPQATQLTEINAFSGGMNNVTAPYLIRRDESVVLTNVNLRRGSMESVPNLIRDRDLSNIYFYQFGNHFLQYGSWRANVVWDNKLYYTDGTEARKILFDGTDLPLGIDAPVENLDGQLEPPDSPIIHEDHYNGVITGGGELTITSLGGGDYQIVDSAISPDDAWDGILNFNLDNEYDCKEAYLIFFAEINSGSARFDRYRGIDEDGNEITTPLPDGQHLVQNGRNVIRVEKFANNMLRIFPIDGRTTYDINFKNIQVFITEDGAGVHQGNFKYTYTYYDPDTGTESAPAPLSLYIDADGQNIRLRGFSALPDPDYEYRIYRIGGYLPYFQMVDTYKPDDTTPIEDYEFLDDLDDTQIDGSELQTLETGKPPYGIKFFVELNGRLFGAVDNMLYYAALGNPDSWYINDFIMLRGEIKGLAPVPGGMLVMGDNWTNILKGTGPVNFIMRVLSDSIGCREAASINYLDTTAIWLSSHGIVMSDGYAIRQLTADRIEDISGLNPTGSVVFNNIYYLSYKPELYPRDGLFPSNDLYPDSVVGTGGVEQGIISIDFKRGNGYAYKIYEFPLVQYIGLKDGKIAVSHGDPNTYAFECEDVGFEDCYNWLPCSGFELAFLNTYPQDQLELKYLAEMEYISPLMVDGSTAMLKEYDKVRIIYRGEFECKIYFDNDREVQYYAFASEQELDFEEVLIGIPNEDNKAYSIRFHIRGRGTVKGIQYSYKFREQA